MPFFRQSKPAKKFNRRGAALVEFAICMPVFFLITMATIETCRMIYLRQSLKIAAYECARLAVIPDVTAEDIQTQCDLILTGRRVKNYQLTCSPADPSTLRFGELFTATVQISAEENALVGSWFYQDKIFTESVKIMAEH